MRRLLLKISGEALATSDHKSLGADQLASVARQLRAVHAEGRLCLSLVVGGGNFLRGRDLALHGIDRATADYMGMLATIMNGLAMQSVLESLGVQTRVLSAIKADAVAEPYIRRRALRHLDKGRVVIFVGGTGSPYFSTDSAAALRGIEIGAECLLKGTGVRGIHAEDPRQNPNAEFFEEISYKEVLQRDLKVMDSTAVTLCRENKLPILVFDMRTDGNIARALRGERLGTLVRN